MVTMPLTGVSPPPQPDRSSINQSEERESQISRATHSGSSTVEARLGCGQSIKFETHVALLSQNVPVFENLGDLRDLPDRDST